MTARAKVSGQFDNRLQAEDAAKEILRAGFTGVPIHITSHGGRVDLVEVSVPADRYREVEQLLRERGAMGWETTIPDEVIADVTPPARPVAVPEADRIDQATDIFGQYAEEVSDMRPRHGFVNEVDESEQALLVERQTDPDD